MGAGSVTAVAPGGLKGVNPRGGPLRQSRGGSLRELPEYEPQRTR